MAETTAVQVAADEGDIARFDGDVGAGADGEADIRAGQGWGVIDAIADHGHGLAGGLQVVQDLGFIGGQDFGEDAVDADLAGDGFGGSLIVTGDHGDFEATGLQRGDGGGGCGFESVADGQRAAQLFIDGDQDDGCATDAAGGRWRRRVKRCRCRDRSGRLAADEDGAAVYRGLNAAAGHSFKVGDGGGLMPSDKAFSRMARARGCSLADSAAAA